MSDYVSGEEFFRKIRNNRIILKDKNYFRKNVEDEVKIQTMLNESVDMHKNRTLDLKTVPLSEKQTLPNIELVRCTYFASRPRPVNLDHARPWLCPRIGKWTPPLIDCCGTHSNGSRQIDSWPRQVPFMFYYLTN